MKTMKGIVVPGDGTVELKDLTIPAINEYQMLVKMKAVALCATDLAIVNKSVPKLVKDSDYPVLLGHECVGEVIEIGDKVTSYQVGDLVVCNPTNYDDPIDGYSIFWGGLSEYGAVNDYIAMKNDGIEDWSDYCGVMKIPNGYDPVTSTILYSFRETFNAARVFRFEKGHSIVIYGAGAMGCGFIKTCRLMGLDPIISIEPQEEKHEGALRAGADYVLNPAKVDVQKEVARICPDGVDYTLDAAGVAALMNDALKLIKNDGSINIFAEIPKSEVDLNWEGAPVNFSINFCQMLVDPGDLKGEQFVIKAVEEGKFDCSDYVSDVFELEEYQQAFELLLRRKNKRKIVLRFE